MNFDHLRSIAESHLGKDTVDLIASKLEKQGNSDMRQLVGASDVDFQPLARRNQDEAQEPPAAPKKKRTKKPPKAAVTFAGTERQPKQPTSLVANITKPEVPQVVSHAVLPQAAVSSASERLIAQAITGEYRYAMLGLILGMSSILGGVILCLHGVAGSTSWTAKLLGLLESQINDAAPGVVLFVVGIFFVVATRPKVKLDKLRG